MADYDRRRETETSTEISAPAACAPSGVAECTQPWGNGAAAEQIPKATASGPSTVGSSNSPAPWWNADEEGLEAEDELASQTAVPRPVLTDGPAPAGLGERLVRELEPATSAPRFAALDRQISLASSDERQAAYRSSAVQDAVARSTLAANEKLALSTALAEGSLRWGHPQGGDSTFYNYFAMQDAKGPPPDMRQMNCFEIILYSAWMLGQLTPDRIVALYRSTPSNRLEHVEYTDIGFSSSLPTWTTGGHVTPSPGDMIFATHPGAPEPWHVMLSLGGESAMSLYKEPERGTPASRVKLSASTDGDSIQFGPAPWNG